MPSSFSCSSKTTRAFGYRRWRSLMSHILKFKCPSGTEGCRYHFPCAACIKTRDVNRARAAATRKNNRQNWRCPLNSGPACTYHVRCPACKKRIAGWSRKSLGWRHQEINKIKSSRGCLDCGYNKHPAALHFDHVRGTKCFTIGEGRTRQWSLVLDEIEKCEVRCANCHAIKSYREMREKYGHRD